MALPRWDAETLDGIVAGGKPVLVDLSAGWCAQCGLQERAVERLAGFYADDAMQIGCVDIDDHPAVADRYGVASLPAFLLFADGGHLHTAFGFKRVPQLRVEIGHHMRGHIQAAKNT